MPIFLFFIGTATFIGILFGYYFPFSTFYLVNAVLLFIFVLSLLLLRKNFVPSTFINGLLVLTLLLSVAHYHSTKNNPILPSNTKIHVISKIVVLTDPVRTHYGYSFLANLPLQNQWYRVECRTNIFIGGVYKNDELNIIGELVGYDSIYSYSLLNPLFRSKSYGTIGYINIKKIKQKTFHHSLLKERLFDFRDWVHLKCHRILSEKVPSNIVPLIESLLFGNYQEIGDDNVASFRRTGLVHLLALSGLQIAFLWGILEVITSILGLRFVVRQWAILLGFLFYRFLVADVSSIDRAILMSSWFILARLLGRPTKPLQILGGSLLFMCLWKPEDAITPGFQLSYAGVLGLIIGNDVYKKWKENGLLKNSWYHNLIRVILVSVCATLTTSPIVVYHFGYLSLISILLNIVAIPITSMLFIGTVFTLLVYPFHHMDWIGLGTGCLGELLMSLAKIPAPLFLLGTRQFVIIFLLSISLLVSFSILASRKPKYTIIPFVFALSIFILTYRKSDIPFRNYKHDIYPIKKNEFVSVIYSSDEFRKLSQLWLRECPYYHCHIIVLDNSMDINPFPEIFSIVNLNLLTRNVHYYFSNHASWTTLTTNENDEITFFSGYLTVRDTSYLYINRALSDELWKLGWIQDFPKSVRQVISDSLVSSDARWLIYRWNKK
ncbi:MAG: ComEC/Rec2 family competence protein [bacterium]|nr:ComEC/Rec2 family competence protein [bacterium]